MTLLKALKIVIVFGPHSAPDLAYDATFNLLWRPGGRYAPPSHSLPNPRPWRLRLGASVRAHTHTKSWRRYSVDKCKFSFLFLRLVLCF